MFRILDLFAGAGGLSLGFEKTGKFEVAAIVENNVNAAKTYIKNHSGLRNYEDIITVDFKNIKKDCGKIDVIIGGPPCQGFSNANRTRRQLINGSNELVKRYVKAIEEIKPKVFVMENVKTIASDKHSFCVTNSDKEYIEKILKLSIYDKDVVLYEGKYVEEVFNFTPEYIEKTKEIELLNEEELYFLYNLLKKKNDLKKIIDKSSNKKVLEGIIEKISSKDYFLQEFSDNTRVTKQVLKDILENYSIDNNQIVILSEFWNIHRFFLGIKELIDKDVIFEYEMNNHVIKVRLKTYIVIDYIKNAFKHLGYKIKGEVLNAAEYGVPQTRERYILIGILSDSDVDIQMPKPIINTPMDFVTVRDAIKDLEKIEPSVESMDNVKRRSDMPTINSYYRKLVMKEGYHFVNNHVCTATRELSKQRFKKIAQGENFHSLPDALKRQYGNPGRTQNTVYRRLEPDLPSETVVNVRKSMWIHPNINRAVSAREAARLQSFPDDYIFYGTKDSVYQQIGNAVPPVMGRAIAETVLQLLGCKDKYEKLIDIYSQSKKK